MASSNSSATSSVSDHRTRDMSVTRDILAEDGRAPDPLSPLFLEASSPNPGAPRRSLAKSRSPDKEPSPRPQKIDDSMAELVHQARGRRGSTEREETAIAVRGALNRRPRGPGELFAPNTNHQNSTTRALTDQEIMDFLESSKRVSLRELCSYITPDGLLNQSPTIDPITQAINAIINNMARTRRMILYRKLTKTDIADISQMETQLARWAADVQEMQGRIVELKGRCLLIHPHLVTDIDLLN